VSNLTSSYVLESRLSKIQHTSLSFLAAAFFLPKTCRIYQVQQLPFSTAGARTTSAFLAARFHTFCIVPRSKATAVLLQDGSRTIKQSATITGLTPPNQHLPCPH
jgi:hypothetical protein